MQQQASIKVWDLGVRLFHWGLVAFFLVAYFSGENEDEGTSSDIHAWAGYTIIGLLLFRVIWGLIGSKHARFRDFIYRPSEIISYLKALFTGSPKHYLGHNPAGGIMVIAMLIALSAISWTGLKAYEVEEGKGPLAITHTIEAIPTATAEEWGEYGENEGGESEEFWEEAHETTVNITLILIILHLGGVFASSLLGRENLARAMITGRKREPDA